MRMRMRMMRRDGRESISKRRKKARESMAATADE